MPLLSTRKVLALTEMLLQPNSGLSAAERAKLFERIVGAIGQILPLKHLSTRSTTAAEKAVCGTVHDLVAEVELGKGRKDLDMLTRHYLSVIAMLPAKTEGVPIPNLDIGEWVIGKSNSQELVRSYSFRRRTGVELADETPDVEWTTDLSQALRWSIHSEAEAACASIESRDQSIELFTVTDFAPAPKASAGKA